jgi:hypothetical protein
LSPALLFGNYVIQVDYYTGTDNDCVLADVDMQGNFLGFEIEGVTQLGYDLLKVRIPSPEEAKEPQKNRP